MPRYSTEKASLGKEIYERDIRHLVEANHMGRSSPLTLAAAVIPLAKMPLPHPKAYVNTILTPRSG